jgi:heme/copper-type cytochrome/quinol oxidase subunit 4
MLLPRFLVGMFTTSTVVAIWTYIATGSVWKALAWTVLTLTILQVGYFLLAFWLFYQRSTKSTDAMPAPVIPVKPLRRDDGVSSR